MTDKQRFISFVLTAITLSLVFIFFAPTLGEAFFNAPTWLTFGLLFFSIAVFAYSIAMKKKFEKLKETRFSQIKQRRISIFNTGIKLYKRLAIISLILIFGSSVVIIIELLFTK